MHNEASFVTGLIGTSGRQVRYARPKHQDQALKIALSVQEAEKQKFSESFSASFDNSLRQHSPISSRRASHGSRGSAEAKYTANQTQGQRNTASRNDKKPKTSGFRNAQTKSALRCYECEGFGSFRLNVSENAVSTHTIPSYWSLVRQLYLQI